MEYPTLITAGTRWLVPREVTYNTPEEVVAHEAGHQFWYGIVGTNEFEHAWMDEGINTYATARAMAEDFPRTFHRGTLLRRVRAVGVPGSPSAARDVLEPALRLPPRGRKRSRVDARVSLLPGDRADHHLQQEALWLNTLERWHRLAVAAAHAVHVLSCARIQTSRSRTTSSHGQRRRRVAISAGSSSRCIDRSNVFDYGIQHLQAARGRQHLPHDRRRPAVGEAISRSTSCVTFENGERVTERWDGRERWQRLRYNRPSRAVSAEVDPDRTLLLDVNRTNNSPTLRPRSGRPRRSGR